MEMSWLLKPGSVNLATSQLLPTSPRPVGRANTDVLNHCVRLRWLRSSTALPVWLKVPQDSPPPVKLKLSVVVALTLDGSPTAKVLMPETCQLSKTCLAIAPPFTNL